MIPSPEEKPLHRPGEVGPLLGHGRTWGYEAVARGDLPVVTICGRKYVPTAALRRLLALDPEDGTVPAPPQPGTTPLPRITRGADERSRGDHT
jgi:hypothetical protein